MAESHSGNARTATSDITKCGDYVKISKVNVGKLRRKIVTIAKAEEKKWRKKDSKSKTTPKHKDNTKYAQKEYFDKYEGSKLLALLKNYYRFTTSDNYQKALEDDDSWSATFISFVMCKALEEVCLVKQTDDSFDMTNETTLDIYKRSGFFPSYRHLTYITLSLYNAKYAKDLLFKYKAIDSVIKLENDELVCTIEEGDVLYFPRWEKKSSQKKIDDYKLNDHTDTIKKALKSNQAGPILENIKGTTHTDVVVKKYIDHKNKIVRLETLGGNTSDSYLGIENTVGRKIWVFHFDGGKLQSFKVRKFDPDQEDWLKQPRTLFTSSDSPDKGKEQVNTIKGIIKIG